MEHYCCFHCKQIFGPEVAAEHFGLRGSGQLPLCLQTLQQERDESRREHLATQERWLQLSSLLNTPETEDFDKAVPLEAAHQVHRFGAEHDAGKNPEDWFWLLGYLAGKALAAHRLGDLDKAKHHCISSAAALRNWHAHLRSGASVMRPGIAEPS
jgi:hypothetical protein